MRHENLMLAGETLAPLPLRFLLVLNFFWGYCGAGGRHNPQWTEHMNPQDGSVYFFNAGSVRLRPLPPLPN